AGCSGHRQEVLEAETPGCLCDPLLLQRRSSRSGNGIDDWTGGGDFDYFGDRTDRHGGVDLCGESNGEGDPVLNHLAKPRCLEGGFKTAGAGGPTTFCY